ncbi:MAG: succinate dehydrogenase cytochrome b subunit [Chthoniobacterales bacterium]
MSTAQVSASPSRKRSLPWVTWLTSSIGRKTIVAVTGIVLLGYVVMHLLGNLSIFISQDAINTYATRLHDLGGLLWIARIGLLVAFVAHIYATIQLTIENRASRPQKYAVQTRQRSTVFARTMAYSGIVVLIFVFIHLAHFTWKNLHPEYQHLFDSENRPDVYSMVIHGFESVWMSAFYIFAIGLLAFHLSHGIGSLFQTLGITNKKLQPLFTQGGRIIAWLLFLGYSSIPIAVLTHVLRAP